LRGIPSRRVKAILTLTDLLTNKLGWRGDSQARPRNFPSRSAFAIQQTNAEDVMGFGRGLLLWLLGIPLPIIILLAIFMHH
jgi:hypothetical protein